MTNESSNSNNNTNGPEINTKDLLVFTADVVNKRTCLICGKDFPLSAVIVVREHTVEICFVCVDKMRKAVEDELDRVGRIQNPWAYHNDDLR